MESVVQLGFEIIPRERFFVSCGFTSGTTSGTSESIRNAPELSTTTAPRETAIGAHSAETSSGTSNIATSMPSNASEVRATTVSSSPRQINFLPALRADAIRRISPQTSVRVERMSSITVPTAPVAPTTARDGLRFIGQIPRKQLLQFDQHRVRKQCVLPLRHARDLMHDKQWRYEFQMLKSFRYSRQLLTLQQRIWL